MIHVLKYPSTSLKADREVWGERGGEFTWSHIDLSSIPHRLSFFGRRCHFNVTLISLGLTLILLRFHIDFTSISLLINFGLTSTSHWFHFASHRYHIDHTSVPHRFHFDLTSVSLRIHFDSIPHRFHFVSLRSHFEFTSVSLRFHFGLTSVSLPFYLNLTCASLKTPAKLRENESQQDHNHRGISGTKETNEMLEPV